MNASNNEGHYRALLEAAQSGFENGRAFLEAIGSSDAAARDVDIQKMIDSITKHLADIENEADQLWDLFKRTQKN
jgi:hypothetical protein